MKLTIYCCLLLLLSALSSYSQKTKIKKDLRFGSLTQVGVVLGDAGNALQVQTINGLRYQTWFAGIGIGLDNYFFRSIPVFIDLRKNLSQKQQSPFVYVDGGYHFLWSSEKDKRPSPGVVLSTDGGGYYEAGLGYARPLGKGISLALSAGYVYKQSSQTVNSMPWLSIWPLPKHARETYTYSLRRMAIKAGITF